MHLFKYLFRPLPFLLLIGLPRNSEEFAHSNNTPKSSNPLAPLRLISDSTSCSKNKLIAKLTFDRAFAGIVYAKGYPFSKNQKPDKRCFSVGNNKETVSINLITTECGVRLIQKDEKLIYVVNLVIQVDKFLQQASNFEVPISCDATGSEITLTETRGHRSGKGMKLSDENGALVKGWMELEGIKGGNQVAVGDTLKVVVKSVLPRGIAACVRSCTAYDGLRERSELLTDSNGCAYDSTLMPPLLSIPQPYHRLGSNEDVSISATSFPAFKFSDTSNLHLQCTLKLYEHRCPQVNCNSTGSRSKRGSDETRMLGKLDVFNSIEVLAPGIDDTYSETREAPFSTSDKMCLSTSDIAVHLAILGSVIFVLSFIIFVLYWRSTSRKLDYLMP